MTKKTVVLIVLDGWGIGAQNESNPIYMVNPANFAWLAENYPLTSLQASGIAVGLPWGEVGNSEVGHLTLGAGKVIYQYFPKIMMAIEDGTFFENAVLKAACAHVRSTGGALNLAGLLTAANVHASVKHVEALLELAEREGVRVKFHLFTDGKDSPPHTVKDLIRRIPQNAVSTLIGRHYAMNRNEQWNMTQRAYECMTGQSGQTPLSIEDILAQYFAKNPSEEFLPPHRLASGAPLEDGDALVFFNFREDSILQIAQAFANPGFDKFPVRAFSNLFLATFTRYSEQFSCPVAFPADTIEKPLAQILAETGKTQIHIAETYKHAHVTFFFNGHRESPFPGEYRVLIPSVGTTHPDEHPELMAAAITDRLLEAVGNQAFDFVLVNYSNPDTIAHTGNYEACLEAVRVIDREIGRVLKVVLANDNVSTIITADHGNMEEVINPMTGQMETQHDINPVPFHLIGAPFKGRKFFNANNLRNETTGIISDVAPTILELMNIPQPPEMTGRSLIRDLLA
jgi:2,3-bisphosphoglycerate-independent phosphoglycerate mutase